MTTSTKSTLKVADEVWIATALLHREIPERDDFTVDEIVSRAAKENLTPSLRPGVRVHALQHCVANRPPNPGRYRMLFATGKLVRRLFRPGDSYDPAREGAKTLPDSREIPEKYRDLLQWYSETYIRQPSGPEREDPILRLRGLGKEIWVGEDPDAYVARLRKDWE